MADNPWGLLLSPFTGKIQEWQLNFKYLGLNYFSCEWQYPGVYKKHGMEWEQTWKPSAFVHRWRDSHAKPNQTINSLLKDLLIKNKTTKNPTPQKDKNYLVCNQEWNARDEPNWTLKGRTQWCISCLWLWLGLTATDFLLGLVRNYIEPLIFNLIYKHLMLCVKKKVINTDLIGGNIIWWFLPSWKKTEFSP